MDPILTGIVVSKLKKYWWAIAGVVILIVIVVAVNIWSTTLVDKGKLQERNETLSEVVKNVKTANEAETFILDANTLGKYCQCLRSTGGSEVCIRYLPDDYTNRPNFTSPKCEQR